MSRPVLHQTLLALMLATSALAASPSEERGKWPPEKSDFALGIDLAKARELGANFQQDAVVWTREGPAPVAASIDSTPDLVGPGHQTIGRSFAPVPLDESSRCPRTLPKKKYEALPGIPGIPTNEVRANARRLSWDGWDPTKVVTASDLPRIRKTSGWLDWAVDRNGRVRF
jgi:hypothetical protein